MAQKGDWGNMMIITLSSTDEPRNKLGAYIIEKATNIAVSKT